MHLTRMPVRESEAIILQSYPLGEADRLVSFLSRSYGRMRGVAKGARRPKSQFGATLERCSWIRIWYFERETRDLVRITQSELIESYLDAFGDYDSGNALTLLAEISEAVLPERDPVDASFRLLLVAARNIQKTRAPALPVAYFALWTMRLAGWLPALEHCARCGQALGDGPGYGAPGRTALWCRNCRLPGRSVVSKAALDVARAMLTERLETMAEQTPALSSEALHDLTAFLLNGIEHQIERKLATREFMETPA